MKVIFWNTKKTDTLQPIIKLLQGHNPEILFLSEFKVEMIEIFQEFLNRSDYMMIETPGCNKIVSIYKNNIEVELMTQESYYTMQKIVDNDNELYIVALHLPSEMYNSMDALKMKLRSFRLDLDNLIGSPIDKETLVVGDFNVNPFEEPMINFDGFRASNCKHPRKTITNLESTGSTYINPTWKLYSRFDYPGTFKYKRPSGYSFDILEWHYLDQVLLSHKLNEKITDQISIIENINEFVFLDPETARINHSDHLPLMYEYRRL